MITSVKLSSKLHKNTCYVSKVNINRSRIVVKSSKTPDEINEMIRKEIKKTNDVCVDMNNSDLECMINWDTIDELTTAYHQSVEDQEPNRIIHESALKFKVPEFFLMFVNKNNKP